MEIQVLAGRNAILAPTFLLFPNHGYQTDLPLGMTTEYPFIFRANELKVSLGLVQRRWKVESKCHLEILF